ncbi:MAG: hypothetical protein AAGA30_16935, partial [Planctomycetota bacterium]
FCLNWLTEDYYDYESLTLYCYLMTLLVYTQSQLATTFITNYLGEAIFSKDPRIKNAFVNTCKINLIHYVWINGILRLAIPTTLLLLFIHREADDHVVVGTAVWLSIMVGVCAITRCMRPFSNEVLCLERPPVYRQENGRINYALRSKSLHRNASGELMGRSVLCGFLCIPFFLVTLGSLLTIDSLLNLHADTETLPIVFYFPIALWIVICFFSVVRFLSYLDIRIRQEGWEVELRMRAEAIRIKSLQERLA